MTLNIDVVVRYCNTEVLKMLLSRALKKCDPLVMRVSARRVCRRPVAPSLPPFLRSSLFPLSSCA
jgi:hypothetical protein